MYGFVKLLGKEVEGGRGERMRVGVEKDDWVFWVRLENRGEVGLEKGDGGVMEGLERSSIRIGGRGVEGRGRKGKGELGCVMRRKIWMVVEKGEIDIR